MTAMTDDTISRREALDALNEQIEQCDKALSSFDISMKDEYAVKVERASLMTYKKTLEYMPSAQPTEASCWGCNCPKMERLKEQKTFSEMVHLHDVEKTKGRKICGLKCLRCKQTYDYSWDTMDEISYTMYSYCPDCIRKGILLLKLQDKEGDGEEKE